MRARIDVSEIEAQTKIRAKYLRALENEEWGLLPGPTFVKSFLRTYAQALDLDGKALVEEYRLEHERSSDAMLEPIVSTPQRNHNRGRPSAGGPSRGYMLAVAAIGTVIVVLVALLVAGGGGSATHTTTTAKKAARTSHSAHRHPVRKQAAIQPSGSALPVSLSLKTSAPVYVCLLGEGGRKVIPGLILAAGESTPTYHSKHFVIRLGNSSVTLSIDGTARTVAPSSEPIGYSITKAHGRQALPSARLPTCK
jgi:cytoskeleton protein RodZ